MENLESWHGDLERGVRGSPDVGGLVRDWVRLGLRRLGTH